MATVNMDAIQFYNPIPALRIHTQRSAMPYCGDWSQVFESYSQFGSTDEDDTDYFPTVEELLRPKSGKEASAEDPANPECTIQVTSQLSFPKESSSGEIRSRQAHQDGTEEQPVILDDGLLDSANRAISSDSNADDANQDASLCNPTATLSCPGNNLGSEKLLGGSLNSALIEQPNAISAYPRNPSPTCLGEPLKDPARQSKDDAHISRDGRLEQCQSTADVLGGVNSEEEQKQRDSKNSGDSDSDQHSDGSDGPRPAKRRRKLQPSPSRSSSRLDRSHTALGQTQLELAPSLGCDGHRGADAEPASIMSSAEYQEWPLHGFLKRTTIGHDIHYGIEFSLEQLQPPTCPPHISWASSNRDSSTASASSSLLSTQAKKIKSGPPSQSMRTRFTSEEDARLVDLKEMKGWSWEKIETEFPGRTRATLQVRYCTKLKTRAAASNQRRH